MGDKVLKQFAAQLGGYSSEYGTCNSLAYVVSNILNAPRLYPQYGDFTEACVLRTYGRWWKISPEYQKPLPNRSSRYFTTDDYIELILNKKVYIQCVNIFETYNPGAVVRILALDESIMKKFSDRWFVMWELKNGVVPQVERGDARIFTPKINAPPFPSKVIRLEFIHDKLDYYTELDAVEVIGTTDVNVDGDDQLSSQLSKMAVDCLSRQIPCQTAIGSDNGYFDLLPNEVLHIILRYLSIDELSILSMVSSLFHEHCYNPLLPVHQHLNLRPFWFRISENSMNGFVKKCTRINSLSMSWCGARNDLFNTDAIYQILKPGMLTRLDLACCPLTDQAFKKIIGLCPGVKELDISSTRNHLTCKSLQMISTLCKLTRLNLFLTATDAPCMIAIARMCPLLETINVGSCYYITDFDEVILAIADNCDNIKHLDLWRAKTLTSAGLLHLASKCKHLESLDIGWCSRVYGDEGCIATLASSCSQLKKLILTANRSIADSDLLALTRHCPLLEQLDLLGNRGISMDGIQRLLKHCKNMIFLDLSFCAEIVFEHHNELQKLYTKCSIKKSFTH